MFGWELEVPQKLKLRGYAVTRIVLYVQLHPNQTSYVDSIAELVSIGYYSIYIEILGMLLTENQGIPVIIVHMNR